MTILACEPKATCVLGLDPGLAQAKGTAWALYDPANDTLDVGRLRPRKGANHARAMADIAQQLEDLVRYQLQRPVRAVGIEAQLASYGEGMGSGAQTTRLAELVGALAMTLVRIGTPEDAILWVHPLTWKAAVVGGRAKKEQVRKAVLAMHFATIAVHGARRRTITLDETDAVAIAIATDRRT